MRLTQWQAKLDASQGKLLPLITISMLCVQVLSAARNPIVIGQALPVWLLVSDAIFLAITAGLVLWLRSGVIPEHLTHPITAFAYMIAGLSAVASIAAQEDPLPFYFAMVMLAGSFCFLSLRYFLASVSVLVLLWIPVAVLFLTLSQALSTLLVSGAGAALGFFIMQRRILNMITVYELKTRVVVLESILPMCASCKKTRDHTGKWQSIETYIEHQQTGTQVSHGSCPRCTTEVYGDLLKSRKLAG
jgi:hypothetical protein